VQFPAQLFIGRDPHEGSFLKGTFLFVAGLAFGTALTFLGSRRDFEPAHRPPADLAAPYGIAPPGPAVSARSNPPPVDDCPAMPPAAPGP
jgi:hypothetical protein